MFAHTFHFWNVATWLTQWGTILQKNTFFPHPRTSPIHKIPLRRWEGVGWARDPSPPPPPRWRRSDWTHPGNAKNNNWYNLFFDLRRSRQVLERWGLLLLLVLWGGAVCQSIDWPSAVLWLHKFPLGWDPHLCHVSQLVFFSLTSTKRILFRVGSNFPVTQFLFRVGPSVGKK